MKERTHRASKAMLARRFPNGEWMLDSLSLLRFGLFRWGGGTIVVKDSRGKIRAFFGPISGTRGLAMIFVGTSDLDAFYARMKLRYMEHRFP
jgi:hypothetical protein